MSPSAWDALPDLLGPFLQRGTLKRSGVAVDRAYLSGVLRELGLHPSEAVLAFEATHGGLELYEPGFDAATLTVGAGVLLPSITCLPDGLVPVIASWDDLIYALDAEGEGWVCAAMVEGTYRRTARDAVQMFTQAVLWRRFSQQPSFETLSGSVGSDLAEQLDLPVIYQATYAPHECWWGDGRGVIAEIPRGFGHPGPMTWVAHPDYLPS